MKFVFGSSILCFFIVLSFSYAQSQENNNDAIETEQEKTEPTQPEDKQISALEKRIAYEKKLLDNPFAIIPHKPNYLLPVTYNFSPNTEPYDSEIDNLEVKFQLSIKVALLKEIYKNNGYLFIAYTQQSYWQAYNTENSSPFRETNHEPELILTFLNDYEIFGLKNRVISFGFSHQSNGRSGSLSRSWNRVYASFIFERGNFYLNIKPWYRLPEDKNKDDNRYIEDYLGHGEINACYVLGKHTVGLMLRNNLRSHNKWGVQTDWAFPLVGTVKGYVQYFRGYGENLIDYNHSNHRIGVGVILTNWL